MNPEKNLSLKELYRLVILIDNTKAGCANNVNNADKIAEYWRANDNKFVQKRNNINRNIGLMALVPDAHNLIVNEWIMH